MTMTFTRRDHAGFSLVELMVAMAITMALSVGMLNLLMSTRSTSLAQNALEQVQEDQRLVLSRLIDTVQNAGYFPSALNATASTVFTSTQAPFSATGQVVYGVSGTGVPGDTLVVRYQAGLPANGDQTLDCSGSTNTTAANLMMTNQFSVDGNGNLICTVNGTAVPLAAGVYNFQVLYGVDTNSDGSADDYLNATAVSAAGLWGSVMSVRVTLTFNNPLAGQAGQPARLPAITQVIPVLNIL